MGIIVRSLLVQSFSHCCNAGESTGSKHFIIPVPLSGFHLEWVYGGSNVSNLTLIYDMKPTKQGCSERGAEKSLMGCKVGRDMWLSRTLDAGFVMSLVIFLLIPLVSVL